MKPKLFNKLIALINKGDLNAVPDYDYGDTYINVDTNFGLFNLNFNVSYHLLTDTSYGDGYLTETCDMMLGVEADELQEINVYYDDEYLKPTKNQYEILYNTIFNKL